ncbi:hypothetical protein RCH08_005466, partial [Janthinobacterium sp. CG_S6]|nr:hypothetical protein [Janthinobacterium sp. CG_S6]
MSGLAAAWIELAHRCFVGMQATSFPEQFGQPVGQRLQGHTDASNPLGVCAADNSCADHVTRFLPASMAIHFRTRKW